MLPSKVTEGESVLFICSWDLQFVSQPLTFTSRYRSAPRTLPGSDRTLNRSVGNALRRARKLCSSSSSLRYDVGSGPKETPSLIVSLECTNAERWGSDRNRAKHNELGPRRLR